MTVNPWRGWLVAVLAIALSAGCSGGGFSPPPPDDVGPSAVASWKADQVVVVAHEDDDLLFLNPDVAEALNDGLALQIIYLTAGDAGRADPGYFLERERGVQAAYAQLVGMTTPRWTETSLAVRGHHVVQYVLAGAPLALVFLRLPDGNIDGEGFSTALGTPGGSLKKLWSGAQTSLRTTDGREQYDRDDLVATLGAILAKLQPKLLRTLDGGDANGFDHSDHRHTALFTELARPSDVELLLYRGYNIRDDAENLAADEADAKWRAFTTYAAHDAAICTAVGCDEKVLASYKGYAARQYLFEPGLAANTLVGNETGSCLQATRDGAVVTAPCNPERAAQAFTFRPDGSLVDFSGRCVSVAAGGVAIEACGAAPRKPESQRWYLFSSGNLMSVAGLCLRAVDDAAGSVALGSCDHAAASSWALRFHAERSYFSADATFDAPQLLVADIDGDGRPDACARNIAGLACARGFAGGFGAPRSQPGVFTDAARWTTESVLRMGDIDGDGHADLCGSADGVYCARGRADGSFDGETRVSSAGAPKASNPSGWDLGDVNGDHHPDVCVFGLDGVRCAINRGDGAFAPATLWLGANAGGAPADARWALADVSGDGRADACQLSSRGIVCAAASRHHPSFVHPRLWMASDAQRIDPLTVTFGDIDRDGDADVCGRAVDGVTCARSNGSSFGAFLMRVAKDPTETSWDGRVRVAFADGDDVADACRWGAFGVRCARAP